MEEEATSEGSPVVLSNPGTPVTTQVSNPGTPRNDENLNQASSVASSVTATPVTTTALNINVPITTANPAGVANISNIHCVSANSLLLQMVPPGGSGAGPGCIPLGSSVTQTAAMIPSRSAPQSKYAQLLAVIEDLGKDIRPTYACSKSSAERLKRGIVHARILVRECLMETERSARS
ncbi:Cyclin-dependent kinase 2-associated protein 1 [Chamberlinius hualienensis]